MRGNIKVLLYISALFLLSQCSYRNKFENKFQNFVSDSDKILFDGDRLHPTYAYLKDGKLKGIEFNGHSVYVIDPTTNRIVVYTKFTNGKEISNNLFQSEKININRYRIEIKNWKNR
ncbi:hypothetical protein [Chryseobacterium populi]|uniref:Uncharacterized protein n=1 Tax=Chryseobacterium populi TaxID=1144316 RepID=J2JL33_9FLAO|nr:hypothetical protein [Chryseobacterium populi]EJL68580.1 hypothetical protein PMI13_03603 [Chryseobacterium populi]